MGEEPFFILLPFLARIPLFGSEPGLWSRGTGSWERAGQEPAERSKPRACEISAGSVIPRCISGSRPIPRGRDAGGSLGGRDVTFSGAGRVFRRTGRPPERRGAGGSEAKPPGRNAAAVREGPDRARPLPGGELEGNGPGWADRQAVIEGGTSGPDPRTSRGPGPGGAYFLMASRMALAWAVRSVSGSSLMNFSRFSAALGLSPLFR